MPQEGSPPEDPIQPPPPEERNNKKNSGKMPQTTKHGFVERFFRVTPTRNAAFITKLFSMVEDESIRDLIAWSGSGDQFTVYNKNEFSRIVLPRYFKHCNWSSFVRQLNMYDFHKVNDTSDENCKENNSERWDFKHPAFNKANFDKLHKIRRKPPRSRLVPQIRYSSSMELLPSNSPEYEGEVSLGAYSNSSSNTMESPTVSSSSTSIPVITSNGVITNAHSDIANHNKLSNMKTNYINIYDKEMNPEGSQSYPDVLTHLKTKADILETKLDSTNNEIQSLKNIIQNQLNLLTELADSVAFLKSMQESNNPSSTINTTTISPQSTTSYPSQRNQEPTKPRKIHELLESNSGYKHIDFLQYDADNANTSGLQPKRRKRHQSKV